MDNKIKCNRCKVSLNASEFNTKRSGDRMKRCKMCNEKTKLSQQKNKCEHGNRKYRCKECGGVSICEHKRVRGTCKECGGGSICKHKRMRSSCKECDGGTICEHKRIRGLCKDCGGSQICEHKRMRSVCKECGGGAICKHNLRRTYCKECGGGAICEHKRQRLHCKICDFSGYLGNIIRSRIYTALKYDKELSSSEYLGCSTENFKKHIEDQFIDGMTWDNYGDWHIDHRTPLKYKKDGEIPSLEDVIKRLHYTNTQPLWAADNLSKGNRFIS